MKNRVTCEHPRCQNRAKNVCIQIDSNKLDLFMKYKLGNPMKQIDELIEMAKDITNKYKKI